MTTKRLALGALILATAIAGSLGNTSAASAATLTGANGMTVYVYDNDAGGKPSCYLLCATVWPPYLSNGEKMGKGWAAVARNGGQMQWTYDGKPVYFYTADTKPGDKRGDGLEGKWHVVND